MSTMVVLLGLHCLQSSMTCRSVVSLFTLMRFHFSDMIAALQPSYQCPSRSTLANQLVPAWYEQVKTLLITELDSVKYVAITSDGWTSVAQDHYLTITCSYISNWTLKTKVLSTKAVFTSQTGEAVSVEIDDVLQEFGVRDKVLESIIKFIRQPIILNHYGRR